MHTAALHLMLLLALVLSSGCASTLCMVSKRHLQQYDGGTRAVYVTNPELRREYEILRASGIYDLSSQPDGAHLLTLHPVRQYGRCANPLLLSIFTLGIVPGVLPAARAFEYDLHADGVTETREHHLPLYERFSIWEWLVRRDEQKVLAEALAWSSLERRPNKGAAAPNRRFPLQVDGLGEFQRDICSLSRSPATVADLGR